MCIHPKCSHTKHKNTNNLCILLIYINNSHTSVDTHVQIFPTPECRDCPKLYIMLPLQNTTFPLIPKKGQQKTLYTYVYPHTSTQTDHCLLPTLKLMYNHPAAAAAAKSLQSCPTLCDPTDGSPPGSSVPGILQARILEWVAISFSNKSF